jgi:hypothetical protein
MGRTDPPQPRQPLQRIQRTRQQGHRRQRIRTGTRIRLRPETEATQICAHRPGPRRQELTVPTLLQLHLRGLSHDLARQFPWSRWLNMLDICIHRTGIGGSSRARVLTRESSLSRCCISHPTNAACYEESPWDTYILKGSLAPGVVENAHVEPVSSIG